MQSNDKRLANFLFAVEGLGIVFVVIFLAAYLGGLFYNPQTTVLHSEPAFKVPLMIFGGVFLALTLAGSILAALIRDKHQ